MSIQIREAFETPRKETHELKRIEDGTYLYEDIQDSWAGFSEGWNAKPFDPWDCVPEIPIKIGHYIRKLSVDPGRTHWQINEYYGTTIEDKIGYMVAAGYNCEIFRNGETKIFKDGKWINE